MAVITRLGRLPVANWGKGTITHEDKEQSGLIFRVFHWGTTHIYFGVKGEALNAQAWARRVGAEQVTKEDAIAARDADVAANATCDMGFTHPLQKDPITGEV